MTLLHSPNPRGTAEPTSCTGDRTWRAQFEKTGERIIEFDIAYLLEQAGEEWRILSYIPRSDQDEAMKKEGPL